MKQNVTLARSLGLLTIPDRSLVDITEVEKLDPGDVCIISTGSQGEPRSALALMASESSRWLTVGPTDTVILSSHPIPGNETDVSRVVNGLVRLGAEVVHSGLHDVHATGHAKQEELSTLLDIIKPEWFIPVHGEYRHLAAHARLAQAMGMRPNAPSSARTATRSPSTARDCAGRAPFRPATSTSTGSSRTWGRPCSGTGGRSPRREWCWCWPPSTPSATNW